MSPRRFALPWLLLGALGLAACTSSPSAPLPIQAPVQAEDLPSRPVPAEARDQARAHTELARAYFETLRLEVALDELDIAARADPGYAPAHQLRALVQTYLQRYDEAQLSYEQAARLAPDDPELNNDYGWFLCARGREQEGLARLQTALSNRLYNSPTKAHANAGLCYVRLQDDRAAERQFLAAVQADPSNPLPLYQLGEIALRQGDTQRAREWLNDLHKRVPASAESLWLGARIEHRLSNRERQNEYGARLRRQFPASPQYQLFLQGRYDQVSLPPEAQGGVTSLPGVRPGATSTTRGTR